MLEDQILIFGFDVDALLFDLAVLMQHLEVLLALEDAPRVVSYFPLLLEGN